MSAARDTLTKLRADRPHGSPPRLGHASSAHGPRLRDAAFAWVEVPLGQGGLAWLAAWTALRLDDDPLHRPALWVDTHRTLTAGSVLDLCGELVVVRPDDPHQAHVAADIALRSGAFSLVALEMHPALHPTPLGRLARLAAARRGPGKSGLLLWGEPPAFIAPPVGVARTTLAEAVAEIFEAASERGLASPLSGVSADVHASDADLAQSARSAIDPDGGRAAPARIADASASDRVRAMDRPADRRARSTPPAARGVDVGGPDQARVRRPRPTADLDRLFAALPRRPDFG